MISDFGLQISDFTYALIRIFQSAIRNLKSAIAFTPSLQYSTTPDLIIQKNTQSRTRPKLAIVFFDVQLFKKIACPAPEIPDAYTPLQKPFYRKRFVK